MSSPTEQTTPAAAATAYLRYDDSVEVKQPKEEETNEEISAVMQRIGTTMLDRFRHALRPVHAKSHGLLKAEMEVYVGLAEPLRQGLFAQAATYPVIIRFSTNPGDILPDSISTPRGMALKVVGIAGQEMLPGHAGETTQDFVLVNGKTFANKDAKEFLMQEKVIELNAADPVGFKQVVSDTARGVNAALGAVGHPSAKLEGLGYPKTHILSETFGTQAAVRYGDYIAKIIIAPLSENLQALEDEHIHTRGHYSALREAVQEFFKSETAVWEVRVQLCTDLEKMPVENAAVEWPEDLSPYLPVAKITALPQETYSPARRVYVDDGLSFNPWHALAAHRPLGNIMRARKTAYEAARVQRAGANARAIIEPRGIGELPD